MEVMIIYEYFVKISKELLFEYLLKLNDDCNKVKLDAFNITNHGTLNAVYVKTFHIGYWECIMAFL